MDIGSGHVLEVPAGGAENLCHQAVSALRDRYQQLTAIAWELLSDFRQVEENFRRLDRQLREKIAGRQGGQESCSSAMMAGLAAARYGAM
jgi:Protein of unknown function (DUF3375)